MWIFLSPKNCIIQGVPVVQINTLFITLMNIEFKTEKLSPSLCFLVLLIPSFSVLNSLFIKFIKRVFVCTNCIVITTKRVYDIFS